MVMVVLRGRVGGLGFWSERERRTEGWVVRL